MTHRNIITGASDGSIAIMELGCGVGNSGWGLKYLLIDNKEDIRHIDTNQDWMAVATVRAVKVFRMEENEKPILVTTIPKSATKIFLAYPFLLIVDGFQSSPDRRLGSTRLSSLPSRGSSCLTTTQES